MKRKISDEALLRRRARSTAYYATHKEEIARWRKPYAAAYYAAHKEETTLRNKTRYAANKEKISAYAARPESRERRRQLQVLAHYGLTTAEYQSLFTKQGGVCAICELPETAQTKYGHIRNLHVDHDHETGVVRGLLCSKCNTAIGLLKDDASIIQKALDYVKTHEDAYVETT